MFEVFIGITALAAILSFLNKKFLKLPDTIGVMILAIILSFIFLLYSLFDSEGYASVCSVVDQIDFRSFLLDFLLGFLLFAGAIHINVNELFKDWRPIFTYATVGVLISTFICGTIFYYISSLLGISISYEYSLLFGALISPTDPIAVIALLAKANTPKEIQLRIIGESLFNDGVGIVVFLSIFTIATMPGEGLDFQHIMKEFSVEVGGGLLFGFVLGYLGRKLIAGVREQPVVAVHISLALVLGGYTLASVFHFSGALAMVVTGLMVGDGLHHEKGCKMLQEHMGIFWKVLDEIFNSILFVLMGLIVVSLNFHFSHLVLGLLSIVIVMLSRFISVSASNILLKPTDRSDLRTTSILTWAGLRGGISIALVLMLPLGEIKETLLFVTFTVVAFSIIVQGLSIEKVVAKLLGNNIKSENQ